MKMTQTTAIFISSFFVVSFVGWIANVVWIFVVSPTMELGPQIYIALLGVPIPIIGSIHGWIWML